MTSIETRHLFTMPMRAERRPYGHTPLGERLLVVVTEATIEGPRLRASLLPGGTDWLTMTPDETVMLDCRLLFQTDDGALIGMSYRGLRHGPPGTIARVNRGEATHRFSITAWRSSSRRRHPNTRGSTRCPRSARGQEAPSMTAPIADEVFEVL